MGANRREKLHKVLVGMIEKLPNNTLRSRLQLYESVYAQLKTRDGEQAQQIRADLDKTIVEIETAYPPETGELQEVAAVQGDPGYLSLGDVSELSRQPTSTGRKPLIRLTRNGLLAGALAAMSLGLVVAAGFYLFQRPDVETVLSVEAPSLPVTSDGEVQYTGLSYTFPGDFGQFDASRDGKPTQPDLKRQNPGLVRFGSDFVATMSDFVTLEQDRLYIGVARFKFARAPRKDEKLPVLTIGLRNYDAQGRLVGSNAYTPFIHSGRIKPAVLSRDSEGFFQVSGLIGGDAYSTGKEFAADAEQFKLFITVNQNETGIPIDLGSLSLIGLD